VRRTLLSMDWSMKQAALEMEWDEATFSRAINGLSPLDLNHLALLPSKFWWKFSRHVLLAVLRREETRHESQQQRSA
jgi:hypothetical protein